MSRRVLLVQLPIPPLGPEPIRGNVPLAGGYLKMFAEHRGLGDRFALDLFSSRLANRLGDQALVEAILAQGPWLVGFTCYLWNIERTLWLVDRLKARRPDLLVVLGGPEITADNGWVLDHLGVDFAVFGEGEQTFAELLQALADSRPAADVPGLLDVSFWQQRSRRGLPLVGGVEAPSIRPREPLQSLDVISSPYLAGILDAADEQMLLLETLRGCVFKCKFCYYPKSYDRLYYLSTERILANLEHARRRGAREVVLLDPTLNQGRPFVEFLEVLIRGNPDGELTFFGELRAEGIDAPTAGLLRRAGFTEVEVGLQSIDPTAMALMDRKNHLRSVERGIAAMRDAGIRVKVDLIVGLPGDTVDSVRRGYDYLLSKRLYDDVQVFNLAVLPGTAFRQEAEALGLVHQPRPPYYVRRTPTLTQADLFELMANAQDAFAMDWDELPQPCLTFPERDVEGCQPHVLVDLDAAGDSRAWPAASRRTQAFTLHVRFAALAPHRARLQGWIHEVLSDNPFTTLQVVLEPSRGHDAEQPGRWPAPQELELLWACLQQQPSYLDRFFALQPGRPRGAKRLVLLLPWRWRNRCPGGWLDAVTEWASVVWRDAPSTAKTNLTEDEHVLAPAAGADA
ncbi:MAG TPA: radical SAM protein [Gemmatales bacterium]|nr:radical SAM protein [Gemmatales bacterium]HMP58001.1 radical SAM protein [Gemmatales bacterium]